MRAAGERHLGAGDRAHAEVLRRVRELERAVDAVVVGERERVVAELGRARGELLRQRGAVEERVRGVRVQLDVRRRASPAVPGDALSSPARASASNHDYARWVNHVPRRRRGRRRCSRPSRARGRSSGGAPAPPSTSGRRRATPRGRCATLLPVDAARRAVGVRLDERAVEVRSVVARNEQCARFRVCVTTERPPPPSRPRLRRRLPSPGAGLPGAGPAALRLRRRRARAARRCARRAPTISSRSLSAGAGSSASFGASAARSRAGSAVGSRSVTVRRHEAPPTSRAQSATFLGGRPARSGRASRRSTSTPSPRRSVSSLPTASGNSSVSWSDSRRPSSAPPSRPALPSPGSRRAGRPAPTVRRRRHPVARQAVRSCVPRAPPAPRSGSRSSGSSVSGSGARNERVRSSETISACPGRATFAAASAANRRSAAPARGVPGRPDRRERPLERRLEPAVEPLDPLRLEVDGARLGRLDREAGVLEPAQDLLPRLLDRRPGPARRARAPGTSRAPPRAASPAARPSPPRRPSPSRSAAPSRAAARAPPAPPRAAGRRRSAARRSKAGMTTAAITGTYVLYEHMFPCQAGSAASSASSDGPEDLPPEGVPPCRRSGTATSAPAARERLDRLRPTGLCGEREVPSYLAVVRAAEAPRAFGSARARAGASSPRPGRSRQPT